jgi:prepilin-type N-terminal cleavage/methylation domain-containing protein
MKLKAGEKGFTLIELLVGISILAFVVSAASMTIITMMRLSPQSNNWAIALRQVQNAGYWISRDVQMSENVTVDENPATPEFLTLTVPEWDAGSGAVVDKTIAYQFEDMGDGLQRLMRDDAGQQIMVAEYISDTDTDYPENCSDNCTLTFTITATYGNVPVTRQYKATQRVPPP